MDLQKETHNLQLELEKLEPKRTSSSADAVGEGVGELAVGGIGSRRDINDAVGESASAATTETLCDSAVEGIAATSVEAACETVSGGVGEVVGGAITSIVGTLLEGLGDSL